jgi:hypothetical protein
VARGLVEVVVVRRNDPSRDVVPVRHSSPNLLERCEVPPGE